MATPNTDVLVIGGGPAGTTFATLMARRGWGVTLLEKDRHPRFHIGESLLPMNLPIFERLGVLEQVREISVLKRGADFTLGNSGSGHQTFRFERALGDSPDHAFEVRRSEFDALLYANARASGVEAREAVRVTAVEEGPGGLKSVKAVDENEGVLRWNARFVVDASGRDTLLASKLGWKQANRKHASAAVFGHFRGVTRRPAEDAGNISVYWFRHGWIWMIPLRDDVMSIGLVACPQYLKTRRGSLDEFLWNTLNGVAEARERLEDAALIMPAQATGNYSYFSQQAVGPGYMLVGDAYAFIDPVFSSGVYLAMSSAERATPVAEAWLRGQKLRYHREQRVFERDLKRGLSTFSWFIYRFTTPAMRHLMNNPRNVLGVEQAVISMLAGDVYSNRPVRWRLAVFKAIYSIACLFNRAGVREGKRAQRAGTGLDVA